MHFHPRAHSSSKAGFTLLELALVIAVIGLLMGGSFVGKSMLQMSRLQATTSIFNQHKDAYKRYLTQYGSKPGDSNGFSGPIGIWGSAGGDGADSVCFDAIMTAGSTTTCNGDGNNFIAGPYVTGNLTKPEEIYTTIQHLSNAKLIEGKYTGKRDASLGTAPGLGVVAGVNVPAGPIDNSGYAFLTVQPITATSAINAPNYFYGNYGTVIIFGNADVNGLNELLKPNDALEIDQKMDDGLPAMGTVSTFLTYPSGLANTCVASTSGPLNAASGRNAIYNVSGKRKSCNLVYVIDTK